MYAGVCGFGGGGGPRLRKGSLTEREGWISVVDLLVLTSLNQLLFKSKIVISAL
jgi:hypothetical protein